MEETENKKPRSIIKLDIESDYDLLCEELIARGIYSAKSEILRDGLRKVINEYRQNGILKYPK